MSKNIVGRVARIERTRTLTRESHQKLAIQWKYLNIGCIDDLDPKEIDELEAFLEEAERHRGLSLENSALGKEYRQELARLGLPQPESLLGIDLIEAVIQLCVNGNKLE
jgi:hypothetical protein